MTSIHGPGQALTFHLELFGKVDRTVDILKRTSVKVDDDRRAIRLDTSTSTFAQRARLMTAMGGYDGDTVTIRKDAPEHAYDADNVEKTIGLLNVERAILDAAETHYVSASVIGSINAAVDSMEPEPLFHTDLPCPVGLLVFETPIIHPDVHPDTGEDVPGLDMPIRAIAWTVGKVWDRERTGDVPGVNYMLYTTQDDWASVYVPAHNRIIPDNPITFASDEFEGAEQLGTWMSDYSAWSFGTLWDDSYGKQVSRIRRWLLAYWRWSWQRIAVPKVHHPNRAERRRAFRAGWGADDIHVKVVRLRREVEAEKRGESLPDDWWLNHAVIVRGHWRRQHYPSLGPARTETGEFNHDSHRLVWVEPHIRGSGQLRVGHNVTAAVR